MFPMKKKLRKTKMVRVRVTPAELAAFLAAAERNDMTLSAWTRTAVRTAVGREVPKWDAP